MKVLIIRNLLLLQVFSETLVDQEFTPVVTATCKAGYMTIRVHTNSSFSGEYPVILISMEVVEWFWSK